jgi:hypothetical protein
MIAETIVRKSVPTDRTEHQEQAALMGWAKKNEHKWGGALRVLYAIPNQGARNPNGDGQRKRREGMRAGVPDVCLPVARRGFNALYIEMKRTQKGRIERHQSDWLLWLSEAGNLTAVCYGADAAQQVIEEYLT